MSIPGEVSVTGDSGTRCFGGEVSTACVTNVQRMFVVVPSGTDDGCSDGKIYPFKAIVFDDLKAVSVMCISSLAAQRLRQGQVDGVAVVREPSADEAAVVASIITCPPGIAQPGTIAPGDGTGMNEATLSVEEKLDLLTAWGQQLFGASAAQPPVETPSAA